MGAVNLGEFINQTGNPKRSALVQKIVSESVFLRVLRFVRVDGMTYEYGEQTTLGSIAFRGLNETYTPDVGVVNPKAERLAILGGIAKTDRQLANKQGGRARANAIMAKVKAAGLFFDRAVINGNPGANVKEFYGLKARLTGNQLIAIGDNGGELSLSKLDELLRAVKGPDERKVLVMSPWCRDKVRELLLEAAGGATAVDYNTGTINNYRGARIEVLDEDEAGDPILPFSETKGSAVGLCTSIYCILPGQDVEGEDVQGLVGSNMIETVELAPDGPQLQDLVEMNAGLAVFHGRAAARLEGIKEV